MKYFIHCALAILLITACTTQRVEIIINKQGEVDAVPHPSNSSYSKTEIVQEQPQIVLPTIVDDSKCPPFKMPFQHPVPSIPKEIWNQQKVSDEKIIQILTEYATELRKKSIENRASVMAAYKQYAESCKK